ncbi:hypothetical protein D1AOALGA4SA_4326 [Olavius algarvensis Delta 1 endosymbiont]|nr:hypothetical protein D1AOALGA4SA_4326 [Olavius algarvensis Delta 1 endosymbiont]
MAIITIFFVPFLVFSTVYSFIPSCRLKGGIFGTLSAL